MKARFGWSAAFGLASCLIGTGAGAQARLVARAAVILAPGGSTGNNHSRLEPLTTIKGAGAHQSQMSSDGRYVAFASLASDLVDGMLDDNANLDVFLYDRASATTTLLSRATGQARSANGVSRNPTISADGSTVTFISTAVNLVPGQSGAGAWQVFVWSRWDGQLRLASHASGSPASASNGNAGLGVDGFFRALPSADGTFVVYASTATDLVPGQDDTNSNYDVFLWSLATNTSVLVSHEPGNPVKAANGASRAPILSADGSQVLYESRGTNLVTGQSDTNGAPDVFLYTLASAVNRLVSHAPGSTVTTGNGPSSTPTVSSDGTSVAFVSEATDLIMGTDAAPFSPDAFFFDVASGTITLISHAAGAPTQAIGASYDTLMIDGTGAAVAFASSALNVVAGQEDTNSTMDVFVWTRATNTSVLASHVPGNPLVAAGEFDFLIHDLRFAHQGRYVLYGSYSRRIAPAPQDSNTTQDFYLYDIVSDTNLLVSSINGTAGSAAVGLTWAASVSADGNFVAFDSASGAVVPASGVVDTNNAYDVFLFDRQAGLTTLVSRRTADTSPPSNPDVLASTSHVPATWSRLSTITMQWSGASDPESGLAGYSVLFDTLPMTTPDAIVDIAAPGETSSALVADGASHWFHLRTCDSAGNCAGAAHRGPYWIDTTLPTTPTNVLSSSHAPGVPSSDTTIDIAWTSSTDAGSGLDGYGIAFRAGAEPQCDPIKRVEEGATTFTSAALPDGNVWVHVCAVDNAGNWSPAAVAGPYRIATNADLGVEQSASPEPVSALGVLIYTITVTNHGGLDATDVVLTDTLPADLQFVSSSPGATTCTHTGGAVTCSLGALAFGSSTSVTIATTNVPDFTGLVSNRVEVTAAQPDANATNNLSLRDTRVVLEKGDIDNDAKADIFFRNSTSGRHVVWSMNGTVRQSAAFVSPDPISPDWRLAVVHDANQDQRNDLLFRNEVTGAVEFWLMQGLVRQGAPVALAGAPSVDWTLQASADFNHDGQADLLWRNTATQALTIWTMNGTQQIGTLTPSPDRALDANWRLVAAQDVSGDGNVDFVWYNTTSGRVVQWLMNATVQRVVGRFTTPAQAGDANWKVVGAANYGGDASPLVPWNDLLWRNETSGRLVVWHMNNDGQRVAGLFTTPMAPADALGWDVVGPR